MGPLSVKVRPAHLLQELLRRHKISLWAMFSRVQDLCRLKFSKRIMREVLQHGAEIEFVSPDIIKMSARVKSMNMLLLAEAMVLHLQSISHWEVEKNKGNNNDGLLSYCLGMNPSPFNLVQPWWVRSDSKAQCLFKLAMEKFDEAIAVTPDNTGIMKEYGDAVCLQVKLTGISRSPTDSIYLHTRRQHIIASAHWHTTCTKKRSRCTTSKRAWCRVRFPVASHTACPA